MYEVEAGATTIWENWNCEDEKVDVPCNTQATIILPDQSSHECGSGQYRFSCQEKCD